MLSCIPCAQRRKPWRYLHRFWTRVIQYDTLKDDDDSQWLLACASDNRTDLFVAKLNDMSRSTSPDDDGGDDDEHSMSFSMEQIFNSYPLAPPSESEESDATEATEDIVMAQFVFKHLTTETGESETEEESMASSSDLKSRRSIRFADEVQGQILETIHSVPWSEHDDDNWMPRRVRCRVEL